MKCKNKEGRKGKVKGRKGMERKGKEEGRKEGRGKGGRGGRKKYCKTGMV